MSSITIGKMAPDFTLSNQDGADVTLSSLKGKKVILFFYPKDDSPSCTKEACSLRDTFKKLQKEGFVIYGISPDTSKKHKKFSEKYEFQYDLLADPNKKVIEGWGLYGEKQFMGKTITGVYRTTVLIDEAGVVSHIIDHVKTAEHGQQILDIVNVRQHMSAAS